MAAKNPKAPESQAGIQRVVAEARKAREARLKGYREQSLRIHPWICFRCGR